MNPSIRPTAAAVKPPRLPITAFVYLIPKKKFVYLTTENYWAGAAVDAVLDPVDGLKPTEWLKRHRAVWVLPEWRRP